MRVRGCVRAGDVQVVRTDVADVLRLDGRAASHLYHAEVQRRVRVGQLDDRAGGVLRDKEVAATVERDAERAVGCRGCAGVEEHCNVVTAVSRRVDGVDNAAGLVGDVEVASCIERQGAGCDQRRTGSLSGYGSRGGAVTGDEVDDAGLVDRVDAMAALVCDVECAVQVNRQRAGRYEAGAGGGHTVRRRVAAAARNHAAGTRSEAEDDVMRAACLRNVQVVEGVQVEGGRGVETGDVAVVHRSIRSEACDGAVGRICDIPVASCIADDCRGGDQSAAQNGARCAAARRQNANVRSANTNASLQQVGVTGGVRRDAGGRGEVGGDGRRGAGGEDAQRTCADCLQPLEQGRIRDRIHKLQRRAAEARTGRREADEHLAGVWYGTRGSGRQVARAGRASDAVVCARNRRKVNRLVDHEGDRLDGAGAANRGIGEAQVVAQLARDVVLRVRDEEVGDAVERQAAWAVQRCAECRLAVLRRVIRSCGSVRQATDNPYAARTGDVANYIVRGALRDEERLHRRERQPEGVVDCRSRGARAIVQALPDCGGLRTATRCQASHLANAVVAGIRDEEVAADIQGQAGGVD